MTNNKTIKINPELFSLAKQKKNKDDKPAAKTKKQAIFKPNNLKAKLLERIKAHKNKEIAPAASASVNEFDDTMVTDNDEFNDSIAYLSSLAKQSNEQSNKETYVQNTQNAMLQAKSKTMKNYNPQIHVELELPEGLKETPMIFNVPANDPPILLKPPTNYPVDNNVPYGCLKGGVKPTYKVWNKTIRQHPQLQSQPQPQPIKSAISNPMNSTLRETKMKELKDKLRQKQTIVADPMITQTLISVPTQQQPYKGQSQLVQQSNVPTQVSTDVMKSIVTELSPASAISTHDPAPIPKPKRIKKTIRRTYTLGKSKIQKKVGVLIKDKNTRKRVLQAQRDIKRQGINEIKQYLRTHGLIKAGSSAPNDIIRKIYETSMLSGEITNQDKDILLQNYLKEKEE
jgi:hypothetical protein